MAEAAKAKIDASAEELNTLSQKIWSHPELYYNEHYAHQVLTDFLEKEGFNVEPNFVLDTAFRYIYLGHFKMGSRFPLSESRCRQP